MATTTSSGSVCSVGAKVNVPAFLFNLATVAAGQSGFLGKDNRVVSDAHPTLLTPSRWAFGIWGVIFLAESVFIVWQARTTTGRASAAVSAGVGPWFAIACVLQAAWSIAFAQELIKLSAILLPAIAVCLTIAVARLAPYKKSENLTVMSPEYWALHFPIGLHAGWTSVASLPMLNMVLESQPLSTRVAALLFSVVAGSVAAGVVASVFNDLSYLCAIAWAFAAIADNGDFRGETLPTAEVAEGFDCAFSVLWVALLVFGAFSVIVSKAVKQLEKKSKIA